MREVAVTEEAILLADGIYCWPGPKRKQLLTSATLGRVLLTSERLLFLSSGKHDVTVKKMLAGAGGNAATGLKTADTGDLDLTALDNKGSLEIPLYNIRASELKGMFKYLVVHYLDAAGSGSAATFAPKNGGMPVGQTWVEEIEKRRREQETPTT